MSFRDNVPGVLTRKPLVAGIVLVAALVLAGFFISSQGQLGDYGAEFGAEDRQAAEMFEEDLAADSDSFEIRTGSVDIESENASEEVSTLKSELGLFNGSVVNEERSETDRYIRYNMAVEVESSEFESFVEWLEDEYEVESTRLSYETVDAERESNEVKILLDALDTYDEMLENVTGSDMSSEQVRLVSEITSEKTGIASELNNLGYELEELEDREQFSKVEISFEQEKDVELTPEDFREDVRQEVRNSVDTLADNTASLVALPITLVSWFIVAVKYVVIGLVLAIPLVLAIKLLKKLVIRLDLLE